MRMIFYNVLDGCAGDPDRCAAICHWLRQQDVDIVGLSELNGWDEGARFDHHCQAAGYSHGHLMRSGPSRYLLGIFSRSPIEVCAEISEGMCHGLLHVRTGGLDCLVTHLAPHDADHRVREAEMIVERMRAIAGPAVLMGDLNSHSPIDTALVETFLTPENAAWARDYRVHTILRDSGLIDLGDSQPDRWSTATSLKPDEPRRRLDFIYINQAMHAIQPTMRSRIVRDTSTERLSDHYPVLAE